MFRKYCIPLLLVGLNSINLPCAISQSPYYLSLKIDSAGIPAFKQYQYKNIFTSILERENELQVLLRKLYEKGYLSATFDSITYDSSNTRMNAYLHSGNLYQWANLNKGNVDEGILNEIGFREKLYYKKAFSYKEAALLLEKLLNFYENNGYPFASVKLDTITFSKQTINASLLVNKNIKITIDTVINHNGAKISDVYLQTYLGIKQGDPYNEAVIERISTRINELPFLKESKPFNVTFLPVSSADKELPEAGLAQINLHLENKKANQIDGIIGITTKEEIKSKFLITGEAFLRLHNSLGRGTLLDAKWRRLQVETQDLKTKFLYPFLFSSPFGLDVIFSIYKKDTTYIDVVKNLGIQYIISGGNYFKVFVENKSSDLISVKGMENAKVLPPYADVSANIYGMGLKHEKLDYRFNPRKGFVLDADAGAGTRQIRKNPGINTELYDSIPLKTIQYNTRLDFDIFIPLSSRNILNLGFNGGYLYNKEIFQNELFRLGGISSLRGFDEESLLASAYLVSTLEYRYLLEQNSYLYLFFDACYYEDRSRNSNISDTPYGIGTGISFETRAGIFTINYALGSQKNNPLDFRTAKIHFKITNYF